MYDIGIMDLDAGRLMIEEAVVKSAVRKLKIKARVSMMADNLAITRQGLMDSVPVLVINGTIVSRSKPIVLDEVLLLLKALPQA